MKIERKKLIDELKEKNRSVIMQTVRKKRKVKNVEKKKWWNKIELGINVCLRQLLCSQAKFVQ